MAEQLGEAVLTLRTDDGEFRSSVGENKAKAEDLGKALDLVTGSSSSLAQKMAAAATSSEKAAAVFENAKRSIEALATAQTDANVAMKNAKAGLDAGTISLDQYNAKVLQARSILALYEQEHRLAQTAMAKTIGVGDAVTNSTTRMNLGGMELLHVIRGATDGFAAGLPVTTIFAEEVSRLGEAAALSGGALGSFGELMAGPWGLAIVAATSVLGILISHLGFSSDAATRASEAHETLAQKLDLERHSYDQVIEAIRSYNNEQERSRTLTLDAAAAVAIQTARDYEAAKAKREKLAADLEALNQPLPAGAPRGAAMAQAIERGSVQSQIDANKAEIAEIGVAARNAAAGVADELAKLETNPKYAIEQKFDRLRDAAKASIPNVAQLTARLAELNRQQEAAEKALSPARGANNAQVGREVDLSEATDIATRAGFKITSGFRTRDQQQYLYDHARTPENPVALPGTSAHERGNALDIAMGPGVSIAAIKKAFEDEGVKLTKVLTEAGHYHIQWSTTGSDKAAAEAKRAADEAARNQTDFISERDQLQAEDIQARRKNVVDLDAIARSQHDQVRVEEDKRDEAIRAKENAHKYTEAQANQLLVLSASIAAAKNEQIERENAAAQAKQRSELESGLLANEIASLRDAEALADTAAERRAIELKILEDEKKQERTNLTKQATDAAAKGDAAGTAVAQDRLSRLDGDYANKRQAVEQQNMGPLAAYASSLKLTSAQRGDKVEGLVVNELQTIEQSIDSAITSRLGIKDPLLSGLIDLFIQQVIIQPIAQGLQNAFGSVGGTGGGGLFGSLFGAIGGLLGGGSSGMSVPMLSGSSLESALSSSNVSFAGFHAAGGMIPEGSWGIVGEQGPEPVIGTRGGAQIMPHSTLASGAGQRPGKIAVTVSGARGNAEIQQMVQQGVAQGIAVYDRQVGSRVKDNLARRG